MRLYNHIEELRADVLDGVLLVKDNIEIRFNLDWPQLDIKVYNMKAQDININNIKAHTMVANNIYAQDINANNITARDISARDIVYFKHFQVYGNIIFNSIRGFHPDAEHYCGSGKITIRDAENRFFQQRPPFFSKHILFNLAKGEEVKIGNDYFSIGVDENLKLFLSKRKEGEQEYSVVQSADEIEL